MRSLSPADVTRGSGGDVEGTHAVSWAAGIMCHYAVVVIEIIVDLVYNALRV